MSDTKYVEFTPETARQFAAAYNKANGSKAESFLFGGNEYVVRYAYYVLEYLTMNKLINGEFDNEKKFIVK